MSTPDFKNYYVVALVLVLLFVIGVGYQIGTTLQSENTEDVGVVDGIPTNAVIADKTPTAQSEIYIRTGQVESVNPNEIIFSTYVQNSDTTYSKVAMTAQLTTSTTFTKINLRDTTKATEDITVSDITVGNEVAVASTDNIYGKTSYTASSVQLHQE